MNGVDLDWLVRQHAFRFLENLTAAHGDVLPWEPLRDGLEVDGERVTLIGARGIWKPAVLDLPISITTSPKDPYGDLADEEGLLQYRNFGSDPGHPNNVELRRCLNEGRPLIYFRAVGKGLYSALWPMVLVHDDPGTLTFTGACEDVDALRPGVAPQAADAARRLYVTRLAMIRLHQARFRREVMSAYRRSCAVCRLHHDGLLDAAHILGDKHERGEPVVPNGLALCKIHHAAFDMNILGIRHSPRPRGRDPVRHSRGARRTDVASRPARTSRRATRRTAAPTGRPTRSRPTRGALLRVPRRWIVRRSDNETTRSLFRAEWPRRGLLTLPSPLFLRPENVGVATRTSIAPRWLRASLHRAAIGGRLPGPFRRGSPRLLQDRKRRGIRVGRSG